MSSVQNSLEPVEFYTSLDPYYHTVDNRPLRNLDNNINKIAQAVDTVSGVDPGPINRSALSSASVAHSLLGFGGTINTSGDPQNDSYFTDSGIYTGSYSTLGFLFRFNQGYMTVKGVGEDASGNVYNQPYLAVHDTVTELDLGTIGDSGNSFLIYASWRDATSADRSPASDSDVYVAEIGFSSEEGDTYPALESGQVAIMKVYIPPGSSSISNDAIITNLNYREVSGRDVRVSPSSGVVSRLSPDTTIELSVDDSRTFSLDMSSFTIGDTVQIYFTKPDVTHTVSTDAGTMVYPDSSNDSEFTATGPLQVKLMKSTAVKWTVVSVST